MSEGSISVNGPPLSVTALTAANCHVTSPIISSILKQTASHWRRLISAAIAYRLNHPKIPCLHHLPDW